MTISSTESKTMTEGNGSTCEFPIPFMFLCDEDIEVVLTDAEGVETTLTVSTDYQLSGAGEQNGGTCTFNTPPEVGQTLVIRRVPAMVQEVDYLENEPFPAATHEAALDKLTMICQSLNEKLERTITFRVSSAVSGVELPDPDGGKVLGWNSSGDNLANWDMVDFDGVLLPLSVANGGTGGGNEVEAQVGLGFGAPSRALAAATTSTGALAALDAEPADTAIIKTNLPDLLQAVFGDEAQTHSGSTTADMTIDRNHIVWTLTDDSTFDDVTLPYDGTYVFHIYPANYALALASSYKTDGNMADPDASAGEIRITVEQFNNRKSIVSLQNMEA